MKTKQVPSEAMRCVAGELRFVSGDSKPEGNGADLKLVPFQMVARTGQPIEHYYWGRIVHDLTPSPSRCRLTELGAAFTSTTLQAAMISTGLMWWNWSSRWSSPRIRWRRGRRGGPISGR